MHGQPIRGLIGLVAVGAATAVGITTRDAGFTALTFLGALAVPRILGLGGRHHGHGCGHSDHRQQMRSRLEQRLGDWHAQAHGDAGDTTPSSSTAPA